LNYTNLRHNQGRAVANTVINLWMPYDRIQVSWAGQILGMLQGVRFKATVCLFSDKTQD
jgi:hypothetical protein